MGMMMQKGLCPFLNEGVHHMSTADGKKIAIVTGSALGLGYELARQLIAKGWFVAGIDFNGVRQAELSKTFAADEYRAFVGDMSAESVVKKGFDVPPPMMTTSPAARYSKARALA